MDKEEVLAKFHLFFKPLVAELLGSGVTPDKPQHAWTVVFHQWYGSNIRKFAVSTTIVAWQGPGTRR